MVVESSVIRIQFEGPVGPGEIQVVAGEPDDLVIDLADLEQGAPETTVASAGR